MIYLIYGEDTFSAKEKLAAVKEKYRSVCGDINLIEIAGEETSWQTLQSQISAMPFLANKRLVIIKFISKAPADVREKLTEWLEKIPSSTVIFIYEEKLDRRMAIFHKLLASPKNCQEFPLFDLVKLKKWIMKKVANEPNPAASGRGVRVGSLSKEVGSADNNYPNAFHPRSNPPTGGAEDSGGYNENLTINILAINRLAEMYGPNLWALSGEIAKLSAYKIGQSKAQNQEPNEISLGDIELLSSAPAETNVFQLIDSLRSRQLGPSLRLLDDLALAGEDELRLLGLVVSQFRNLLTIFDLKRRQPNLSAYQIATQTGAKPFVVTKALGQLRSDSLGWLKSAYQSLADIDYQIKTGQLSPSLALDLLAIKVCGNLNSR